MGFILGLAALFAFAAIMGPALVGMIAFVLASVPSAMIVYTAGRFIDNRLDLGQVITFTVLTTFALFFVLKFLFRFIPYRTQWVDEIDRTPKGYALAAMIVGGLFTVALLLVLHFGFHNTFPAAFVRWLGKGDMV